MQEVPPRPFVKCRMQSAELRIPVGDDLPSVPKRNGFPCASFQPVGEGLAPPVFHPNITQTDNFSLKMRY